MRRKAAPHDNDRREAHEEEETHHKRPDLIVNITYFLAFPLNRNDSPSVFHGGRFTIGTPAFAMAKAERQNTLAVEPETTVTRGRTAIRLTTQASGQTFCQAERTQSRGSAARATFAQLIYGASPIPAPSSHRRMARPKIRVSSATRDPDGDRKVVACDRKLG